MKYFSNFLSILLCIAVKALAFHTGGSEWTQQMKNLYQFISHVNFWKMKVINTDTRLIIIQNIRLKSIFLILEKIETVPDFSLLVKVAQKDIPANAVGTLGLQGCFWTKAVVSWHNTTIAKLQPKCHLGYYLHVFFRTIFLKLFHKPIVGLIRQH